MLARSGHTIYIDLPGGEGERVRIVDTASIGRLDEEDVDQAN